MTSYAWPGPLRKCCPGNRKGCGPGHTPRWGGLSLRTKSKHQRRIVLDADGERMTHSAGSQLLPEWHGEWAGGGTLQGDVSGLATGPGRMFSRPNRSHLGGHPLGDQAAPGAVGGLLTAPLSRGRIMYGPPSWVALGSPLVGGDAPSLPQGRPEAGDHHLKFQDDWDKLQTIGHEGSCGPLGMVHRDLVADG